MAKRCGTERTSRRRIGKTLHKLVIYSGVCRERFRCPRAAHLRVSLSLYDVSVRSLAALARNVVNDAGFMSFRLCGLMRFVHFTAHSAGFLSTAGRPNRSCPRLVLHSQRNIWHTASSMSPVFVQGTGRPLGRLHPTSPRPCWAYQCTPSWRRCPVRFTKSLAPTG